MNFFTAFSLFVVRVILFLPLIVMRPHPLCASTGTPPGVSNTIQASQSAPLDDIFDIYGPLPLPHSFPYLFYGIMFLAVLLLALGGILAYRFLKKRQTPESIDPAVLALTRLEKAESRLPIHGVVLFANEISAILRSYIEARFDIPSLACTTNEFFRQLKSSSTPETQPSFLDNKELRQWFFLCDRVKFSRFHPEDESIRMLGDHARQFIETTRLRSEEEG